MRRPTVRLVQILAFGLVALGAGRVSGEPFLDLYGGVAQTEATRVTAAHAPGLHLGHLLRLLLSRARDKGDEEGQLRDVPHVRRA